MRIIVFDRELHEPLTVVNLQQGLFEHGKQHGNRIYMPALTPIGYGPLYFDGPVTPAPISVVSLELRAVYPTRACAGDPLFWYAYADQPELALLLRAAFLPGQVGELQQREALAYFRGALGLAPT